MEELHFDLCEVPPVRQWHLLSEALGDFFEKGVLIALLGLQQGLRLAEEHLAVQVWATLLFPSDKVQLPERWRNEAQEGCRKRAPLPAPAPHFSARVVSYLHRRYRRCGGSSIGGDKRVTTPPCAAP